MSTKNNIFRLTGKVQHYQWGGFEYIPSLLGISNNGHEPYAEYWLGAHGNAPAMLADSTSLDNFLQQHPSLLGSRTQEKFGRLPYLLKILDVKDMLSIQVHPNKKAAEQEFAKENTSGVALNAPNRNYKDDNHKPELMTALSDFWLLHGFRNADSLIQTISAVPEFGFMLPLFEKGSYKALYEAVMTMPQQQVNATLQSLLDRIIPLYQANQLDKHLPDFWAARAALTFNQANNIDRGIFSVYLFNIVFLKLVQRDKNDNAGHIILPLVNKTEENVVFPLVLNVISRFWGEEIPRLEIEKRSSTYKSFKGIVFIEGLEIIEKNLNLSSIVYRGSISDIKKRVNQGFPVIVILPGIGDIVQFATIVCGYDDNEKRIITYIPEPDSYGAIPEHTFEEEWSQDDYFTILVFPKEMTEIFKNDLFEFNKSNRIYLETERLKIQGKFQESQNILNSFISSFKIFSVFMFLFFFGSARRTHA